MKVARRNKIHLSAWTKTRATIKARKIRIFTQDLSSQHRFVACKLGFVVEQLHFTVIDDWEEIVGWSRGRRRPAVEIVKVEDEIGIDHGNAMVWPDKIDVPKLVCLCEWHVSNSTSASRESLDIVFIQLGLLELLVPIYVFDSWFAWKSFPLRSPFISGIEVHVARSLKMTDQLVIVIVRPFITTFDSLYFNAFGCGFVVGEDLQLVLGHLVDSDSTGAFDWSIFARQMDLLVKVETLRGGEYTLATRLTAGESLFSHSVGIRIGVLVFEVMSQLLVGLERLVAVVASRRVNLLVVELKLCPTGKVRLFSLLTLAEIRQQLILFNSFKTDIAAVTMRIVVDSLMLAQVFCREESFRAVALGAGKRLGT